MFLVKVYSNTTLVKVKFHAETGSMQVCANSNTTLVKVKLPNPSATNGASEIQIQHLLKLNARKINLYDFHYTIKSIDIQGF